MGYNGIISTKYRIVGVGGCGCNCLNWIQEREQIDSGYVVIDSDTVALDKSPVRRKLRIDYTAHGKSVADKMAAVSLAATEMKDRIRSSVAGNDFVFLLAGMGGVTGTSAAPAAALAASEAGAVSVALVTMPFTFEGKKTRAFAELGLDNLGQYADTVFCVENDALLRYLGSDRNMNMVAEAGYVFFYEAILTLMDTVNTRGELNVSLIDVKNILSGHRLGIIGMGESTGGNFPTSKAMTEALDGYFLKDNLEQAASILVVIRGADGPLYEVNTAMGLVNDRIGDGTLVFNHVISDSSFMNSVRVVIFAVYQCLA